MAEVPSSPSREEREFWDAPVPRRPASTSARARPRRAPAPRAASGAGARRTARPGSPTACTTGAPTRASASSCWWSWRVVAGIGRGTASASVARARASRRAPPRASTTTTATSRHPDDRRPRPRAQPSTIAVHVAGAVTHPGVVELRAGARVIDAVEAVGGALADGDLDRLNLAAKVADGERVYVAKVGSGRSRGRQRRRRGRGRRLGEPVPARRRAPRSTSTPRPRPSSRSCPASGPRTRSRSSPNAQRRGGFTSVNDLRSVRGIGDKRFAELAPLVTV